MIITLFYNQSPELFIFCKTEILYPLNKSIFPSLQLLATTILLFISVILTSLGTSKVFHFFLFGYLCVRFWRWKIQGLTHAGRVLLSLSCIPTTEFPSFVRPNNIPIVCVCHVMYVYSSIDGYSRCFCVLLLWIVLLWTWIQIFLLSVLLEIR